MTPRELSPVRLASPYQLYVLNRAGRLELVDDVMPLDADTAFQTIAENIEQARPVVAKRWLAKDESSSSASAINA